MNENKTYIVTADSEWEHEFFIVVNCKEGMLKEVISKDPIHSKNFKIDDSGEIKFRGDSVNIKEFDINSGIIYSGIIG